MQRKANPAAMKRLKQEIKNNFGTIVRFEKHIKVRKGMMTLYLDQYKVMGPQIFIKCADALNLTLAEFRQRYYAPKEIEFDLVELVRVLYDNHDHLGHLRCHVDAPKNTTSHIVAIEYIAHVLCDLNISPDQLPTTILFYAQIKRFMRETLEDGHGRTERQPTT